MPSLPNVLLASAVVGVVSAVPFHGSHGKTSSSFKVDMIPKTNTKPRNGAAAYAKALTKFGGAAEHITNVLAAADVAASSVTATPQEDDLEYTCPVQIGDQTFQLDFDTGSSDLWVLGQSLSSSGGNHTYYSPSSTATLQNGSSWKISYGDGSSASGTVYQDTVTVGGTTVTKQAVEAATKASSEFTGSSPEDGLLGLAFDTINTVTPKSATTFFSTAVSEGLPEALFTALLKHNEAGSYTFGEIDSSQYTGDISYTDVDSSQGFWMFSPTSFSVGTSTTSSGSSSTLTGIADTGTTLMLVDDSVVSAYYKNVNGAEDSSSAGGYVFDCSADLPDFNLVIGDYTATVPGSFINYSPNGDGTCFGGIQSSASVGFAIYGDIFLKSQFVVFDNSQSSPRLGFAAQA